MTCPPRQISFAGNCVPDPYTKEDAFFGSKKKRLRFLAYAEQVTLSQFTTNMRTGDHTKMTIELQHMLRDHVLKDDVFCFSGFHHVVMLLSTLSEMLHRGPRERLLIDLRGAGGFGPNAAFADGQSTASDTLFRIDVIQKDFGEAHSYRVFQRLGKVFPLVTKYAPPIESLLRAIDANVRVPSGFVYEGCHSGMKAKQLASFEGQSHFENAAGHLHTVADGDVLRFHAFETDEKKKRNYFVCLNVALRLRKGSTKLHFHVPVRILSIAVYAPPASWIQPRLVDLPRARGRIYSATNYTLFVFFLYWFKSTKLLLAGAAAVIYMLDDVDLATLDRAVTSEDAHVLAPILKATSSFTREQRRVLFTGMRYTLDAFMASAMLNSTYRVNFISPETIEDVELE